MSNDIVTSLGSAIRDIREKVVEEGWFGRTLSDGTEVSPADPPEHSGSLFRYASSLPAPKPEAVIHETYAPEAEVMPTRNAAAQDVGAGGEHRPGIQTAKDDAPGINFDSR